jgi:hypothetical protein
MSAGLIYHSSCKISGKKIYNLVRSNSVDVLIDYTGVIDFSKNFIDSINTKLNFNIYECGHCYNKKILVGNSRWVFSLYMRSALLWSYKSAVFQILFRYSLWLRAHIYNSDQFYPV